MGYLNPIMKFGFEAFCQKCVECGIDGVIIPDLPFKRRLILAVPQKQPTGLRRLLRCLVFTVPLPLR